MALRTLAICLSDLKRDNEAVSAAREVVSIYRYLARTDGDYLPDLAESLHDLATYLPPTGNRPEALATIREATKIRRKLARHDPGSFTIDLARSLDVCATILDWCGQPEQTARIRQEIEDVTRRMTTYVFTEPTLSCEDYAHCITQRGRICCKSK